jgi:metal-sulfur cluster biosynthetic enzyme
VRASPAASSEDVRRALAAVYDPCSQAGAHPTTIVDLGLVRDVSVSEDGRVRVLLGVTGPGCLYIPQLGNAVEHVVGAVPGVASVQVDFDTTFVWTEAAMSEEARARRNEALLGTGPAAAGLRPRQWQERQNLTEGGR